MGGPRLSVLLLASLVVVAAGVTSSLAVMLRSGETRVALLTGLFLLLGMQQGVSLWLDWGQPLAFDLPTGLAAASLAASLLGLLAVLAVGRSLQDLDRAESIHWDSMEGVRALTDLAARRELDVEDKLDMLLEMGCERLGLEIALVSRVRGERYEVLAIHAPEDYPIAAGAVFTLDETACRPTLASERPVAVSHASERDATGSPARTAFGFEAYLGAAIRVGSEPFGTLVFGSLEPRRERLTATHKDLALLMAQWLGAELERKELLRVRGAAVSRGAPRPAPRPLPVRRHTPQDPNALSLDATLDRLRGRIQRAVPPGVRVQIEPNPGLAPARAGGVPVDAIVLSLVQCAAQALPEGGTLRLATANHEPLASEPGVLPAVAPERYVTLSVTETSGALEADALDRVFAAEESGANATGPRGALSLARAYRLLQRAGGDLSVEVEPGRGSRFTLFLPRADAAPKPSKPRRRSVAPAASPRGPQAP